MRLWRNIMSLFYSIYTLLHDVVVKNSKLTTQCAALCELVDWLTLIDTTVLRVETE